MILDMRPVCVYTDFFVVCSGRNTRQVRAIWEDVRERLKHDGERVLPRSVDGERESSWIVGDFLDVVLHVFTPETRAYYRLEDLGATCRRSRSRPRPPERGYTGASGAVAQLGERRAGSAKVTGSSPSAPLSDDATTRPADDADTPRLGRPRGGVGRTGAELRGLGAPPRARQLLALPPRRLPRPGADAGPPNARPRLRRGPPLARPEGARARRRRHRPVADDARRGPRGGRRDRDAPRRRGVAAVRRGSFDLVVAFMSLQDIDDFRARSTRRGASSCPAARSASRSCIR